MEPIQVYLHEEYDLQITKPKSYFSLLPLDVKKLAYHYFDFFSWEQLDELIERDNPEEFEFKELPIAPFNWRVSVGFDRAIKTKKWNSALCFLKWGANPNSECDNRIALLHAVDGNCAALVESLLRAGARPTPMQQEDCWYHALRECSGQIIKLFIEMQGFDPNNNKFPGFSLYPIEYVVKRRNIEGVKVLLTAGASVNVRHECGHTPLYEAAYNNDIPMARLLLEAGALSTLDGSVSPLSRAAIDGYTAMVQLILQYTKQVDPLDEKEDSALEFACLHSRVECVKLLLAAGADPARKRPKHKKTKYDRYDNAVECAFIAFQWCKTPQQKNDTRQVFIELFKKIQVGLPRTRTEIIKLMGYVHDVFCLWEYGEPPICHFAESKPELKGMLE